VAFVKTTFTSHDAATAPVTILDGHEYEAQIDGYDTDAIAPQSTGSRTMVDGSKAIVTSRWTATCGGKETPMDAGAEAEAGADAAPVTATDAATGSYGACRAALAPDGGATGDLSGPVCAFEGLTLVMRHCTPLRPR